MKIPYIFLDIDGVLNSVQYAVMVNRFHPKEWNPYRDKCCLIALSNLEEVIETLPDAKIVISSTWRTGRTIEQLQDIFRSWGFSKPEIIVGKTGHCKTRIRGNEIQEYIDEHQIENYCIIDDDSDMLEHQESRFVQTDGFIGLTYKHIFTIVEILGGTYR